MKFSFILIVSSLLVEMNLSASGQAAEPPPIVVPPPSPLIVFSSPSPSIVYSPQPALPAASGEDARRQAADRAFADAERALTIRLLDRIIAQNNADAELASKVKSQLGALTDHLTKLRTSDEGKRLAASLDAISARQIQSLYTGEIISVTMLDAINQQVQASASELKKLRADPPPGFVPSEAQQDEPVKAAVTLRNDLARINERIIWLNELLASASQNTDVAKAPTLEAKLADFDQKQRQLWNAAQQKGIDQAQPESVEQITAAANTAELERALEHAQQIIRDTRAELESIRIEDEMQINQIRSEQRQREDALNKKLAALEAAHQIQIAQNEVTVKTGKDDADLLRKRKACHDHDVLNVLSPFLAKGYWQPKSGRGIDSEPMSLSQIRAYGALDPSKAGLERLMQCANLRGNDRPHWGLFLMVGEQSPTPTQIEAAKRAQAYLINLGDALLAEGLLSN